MDKKELLSIINSSYSELKDFQKATVENAFNKLYIEKQKRHLVADEVGLGKTIVAKGLIARAMERHLNSNDRNKPFHVVYICSNQALTEQNLKKLNIFKKKEFLETDKGRLIFQAFKPLNSELFQVSSLTPSTSFRLIKGTGIAEERKLIWLILSRYKDYNRGKRNNGLKLALLGNISNYKETGRQWESIEKWKDDLNAYQKANLKKLRSEVFPLFRKSVEEELIDVENWYFNDINKELGWTGKKKLKDILIKYSELLRIDNVKKYEGPKKLLGKLRELLTKVCLDFIEADLYILDEFQRFKDLIIVDEEKMSEASVIAQKVFSKNKSKVLMLSATPFKPFTNSVDADFDEDHYKEFKDVLSFLFNKKPDKLTEYDQNRKIFFELLRRPEEIYGAEIESKNRLEQLYREVISRTERLLVSDDNNTLLKNSHVSVGLKKEDILNFIETDKIIVKLNEVLKKGNHTLVDFSKSSPYPLSFMDQYKIKEDLRILASKNKELKNLLNNHKDAWINLDRIQLYKSLGEIPNGNLRILMDNVFANGMWKNLWLSPSLPYYEPDGSFKDSTNNSKVLVFSKWRMVPRLIASIISYESERLSIGNTKLKVDGIKQYTPDYYIGQEKGKKKKRQPRKPGKILALKLKNEIPQTMSAFSLVYPSMTLANIFSIQNNSKKDNPWSLSQIKDAIKECLKKLIKDAELNKYKVFTQKTSNWYWAAPLLLDKFLHEEDYENWFRNESYKQSIFLSNRRFIQDEESDNVDIDNVSSRIHFERLKNSFYHPESLKLGEFPDDLFEVIALQVIASPAVASLRLLFNHFQNNDKNDLLNGALDIASQFYALFDKPESIAVVKLASIEKKKKSDNKIYWKEVLEYCSDGNIQSVLDEFGHLISSDYNLIHEFVNRISKTVNNRTSNLHIDDVDTFLKKKDKVLMRCHYAVDFGNQNMDQEEGKNRVKVILDSFNSPFRPFVLASTSIGQEGLDFHYYCRKVMHWNLPSNPIDIEQREGRVNRFKGLVIRQNIVKKYKSLLKDCKQPVWEYLFDVAELHEGKNLNKCQLVPFWHIEAEGINIERIIPLIPFSREVSKLKKMFITLTLYRLTFGQPRQEELVEALYKEYDEETLNRIRNQLMINLSPITYNT